MTTVDSQLPVENQAAFKPPVVQEPPREKFRILFRKDGPLRFISHHDLLRCWERLLRRAELPLRFSQGFHPKPRLSFPIALSLGAIGAQEILEIELVIPMTAEDLRNLLLEHAVP